MKSSWRFGLASGIGGITGDLSTPEPTYSIIVLSQPRHRKYHPSFAMEIIVRPKKDDDAPITCKGVSVIWTLKNDISALSYTKLAFGHGQVGEQRMLCRGFAICYNLVQWRELSREAQDGGQFRA